MTKTTIVRSSAEIDDVLNWAADGEEQGTHHPAATYEEGLRAMYDWLVGDSDTRPDEG